LALIVEGCEYDRLHATFAYEFERVTAQVPLVGAGTDGFGEVISTRRARAVAGASGVGRSAALRNWAFESAALDLALRRAGHSLHDVLGLTPPAGAVRRLAWPQQDAFDRTGAPAVRPSRTAGA
jgi:hypothetical protein